MKLAAAAKRVRNTETMKEGRKRPGAVPFLPSLHRDLWPVVRRVIRIPGKRSEKGRRSSREGLARGPRAWKRDEVWAL